MLSISHSSIFYVSMDRFTSHQRRGKRSFPQFSKKFDPQIRNFRKKHTIILTSMTYPSQFFFFFFVGIKSIDWIPPKTRPWRHQSGRFYLFIRGCANSTNRGRRRRRRKHRWIFFPSLCFRLESIPAQTRQTNRGRGGIWIFQTRDHSV